MTSLRLSDALLDALRYAATVEEAVVGAGTGRSQRPYGILAHIGYSERDPRPRLLVETTDSAALKRWFEVGGEVPPRKYKITAEGRALVAQHAKSLPMASKELEGPPAPAP